MTSIKTDQLEHLYALIRPGLSSLREGGIVGDLRHIENGGYHISREDLIAHGQTHDYSIQTDLDKAGPADASSAIDIDLNPVQMALVTGRLKAAFAADDPRIHCLREFIGTLDGKNVCGWNRIATGTASRSHVGFVASGYSEVSHLWHVHLSVLRAYCADADRIAGVADVILGKDAPASSKPKCSLAAVVKAAQTDPHRAQGGTTPGAADDVKLVEKALLAEGFLASRFAGDGAFGSSTVTAYASWQRKLGYSGADANGIPGKTSLTKLGAKHGFSVVS